MVTFCLYAAAVFLGFGVLAWIADRS